MSSSTYKKKLLLMGRSGSGKSSMRSMIFSNFSAFDTRRLGATIDVEHSHLRFLGNIGLNLWDCGGQDVFMENYFSSQKDHIFSMVEVLIHVFDVESKQVQKDIDIFMKSLEHLAKYSPNAKIFVLVHKMDLVQVDKRDELFVLMMKKLENHPMTVHFTINGFATSIWDESLYKAWSCIVCALIPNMTSYEKNLKRFNKVLEAEEIILFEKSTFLVITSTSNNQVNASVSGATIVNGKLVSGSLDITKYVTDDEDDSDYESYNQDTSDTKKLTNTINNISLDPKRFEKISNIIKNYKHNVSRIRSNFTNYILHASYTDIYVDVLTDNIFVMIVLPTYKDQGDGIVRCNEDLLVLENVKAARKWFEDLSV